MRFPRLCLGASVALVFGASPLAAIVDRNGDGLSDVWAALYHPTKGATADEDGDGFTNAQEALAGTDPENAASRFAAAPQVDAAGNLVLRWRGAWGKRYAVESSTDLKTWAALAATHIGRGQELSVVVQTAGSAAEARRHWRVVVADVDTDGDGMTNAEEIELGSDPTAADAVLGSPPEYVAEFFVSPNGSDANPGTKAAPFHSLDRAKEAVLGKKALLAKGRIAVWLRGGVYEFAQTFWLHEWDSGVDAAHTVDWRGYPGEEVRVTGAKRVATSAFTQVTVASPIWGRLDDAAKGRVLQVDLKPVLGVTAQSTPQERARAYGELRERGFGYSEPAALELFIDDVPMTLARWPDVGPQMPLQDFMGDRFKISGVCAPDVTGAYSKIGMADGVSSFARDGLVDGKQWYLYRSTWVYQGQTYTAWRLSTKVAGQPGWICYGERPALFARESGAASGIPSGYDPERINAGYATTADPSSGNVFAYAGDRPSRWLQAPAPWVEGFWMCNWGDQHLPVTGIDRVNRLITLPKTPDRSQLGMAAYRPWFAYNLLEEITQPGEWYLDRDTGVLYLWPPGGFSPRSEIMVTVLDELLVQVSYARHVRFMDLTFEGGRGTLIDVDQSTDVSLWRVRLRNSGAVGLAARGSEISVRRSELYGLGNSALFIDSGDRPSLTPGGSRVEDCEIHHFGRTVRSNVFGIGLHGCGNVVRHNLIHDAPNGGIVFGGNEHLIERNEIRDVCQGSSDAGGIYCGGSWVSRGNLVRHNFIHHLHSIFGTDVQGIYIDETGAGYRCEGNVLAFLDGSAIQLGGGRDNILLHNIAFRCGSGLLADARGLTQMTTTDGIALLKARQQALLDMNYRAEPWLSRYPLCAAIPGDWATLVAQADQWLTPRGTVFSGNLGWQNTVWISGETVVRTYCQAADNVVDRDPLFIDETNLLLGLKPGSPVSAIPGWEPIPFGQIGIRE